MLHRASPGDRCVVRVKLSCWRNEMLPQRSLSGYKNTNCVFSVVVDEPEIKGEILQKLCKPRVPFGALGVLINKRTFLLL